MSWTQTNSSWSSADGKYTADVNATGTLVTEANILGQNFRETYDHVIGMKIRP